MSRSQAAEAMIDEFIVAYDRACDLDRRGDVFQKDMATLDHKRRKLVAALCKSKPLSG